MDNMQMYVGNVLHMYIYMFYITCVCIGDLQVKHKFFFDLENTLFL